jgi:hypothetical protein
VRGEDTSAPRQNIQALVVLYAEESFAISTDFTAFYYKFEARGIQENIP